MQYTYTSKKCKYKGRVRVTFRSRFRNQNPIQRDWIYMASLKSDSHKSGTSSLRNLQGSCHQVLKMDLDGWENSMLQPQCNSVNNPRALHTLSEAQGHGKLCMFEDHWEDNGTWALGVCGCVYLSVCPCVCLCLYLYPCMCLCMYLCVCVCLYPHVCVGGATQEDIWSGKYFGSRSSGVYKIRLNELLPSSWITFCFLS